MTCTECLRRSSSASFSIGSGLAGTRKRIRRPSRTSAGKPTPKPHEALRPEGLRTTQFTLLQVLARAGSVTQGVLADIMAADSTTLSRTLKPLQAARWIRTFPGGDRRERHLELTPAGRRVLERATPA